jgi:putative component of toxin-antitoxin plasmid stabilization module
MMMGNNTYFDGVEDVRIKIGFSSRINLSVNGDILLQTASESNTPGIIRNWNTVTIRNNGNVGIGTIGTPRAKLEVNGSFRAESATIVNLLTTDELNVQNANISEKLGVGVSGTPRTNMQIGAFWTFQDEANTNNMGRNTYFNGTNDVRIQQGFASRISFNNDGDILLQTAPSGTPGSIIKDWNMVTFANNGNVGIGTTEPPSAKLEVNGSFKAQSTKITGLLCAAEVKINGVNVGEMNAILLQKIEEQMLYIIQIEKRITELENVKR